MADPSPKISAAPFRSSAAAGAAQRTSVAVVVASVLWVALLAWALPGAASERFCSEWNAELVAIEGIVEVDGPGGWSHAHGGMKLCTGQSVRVLRDSRATLVLLDQNKTVLRLHADSTLTLSAPERETGVGTLIRLLQGLIHVISRDPLSLSFDTPYANAGLEGTEFVISALDDGTDVVVIEGTVRLSNAQGAISVPSGQRGTATPGHALSAERIDDPLAALSWTPHYTAILDRSAAGSASDAATVRAAQLLTAGRLDDAERELGRATAASPDSADAIALTAMLHGLRKDYGTAEQWARRATTVDPNAASAWLALSYAREAVGGHADAWHAALRATAVAPSHAFAWARTAELAVAKRDYAAAREAAERSIELDPGLAHPHTALGFAQLHDARAVDAMAAFRSAIALDPAPPLPRLGLALALFAAGDRVAARQEMELAVGLDPTNAALRAYMAKIYDAENRGELSGTTLDLAKAMRPDDPTAWYYDALRKQSRNRLVEAVRDLRTANRLNDGQPVYRSSLLVDEDLPARSAGVGRLYAAAGADQLALIDAWTATTRAPADYAGHRLLADVYAYLPRHQIARVNELYQSQLLQPETLTPVRPQLGDASLFVLDTLGPSTLAHPEYQALVRENGVGISSSAIAAGNGTRGVDFALHGLGDRVSYSVGVFDWQTDGFRPNNDLSQRIGNALIQFRPSAATTFTTELRTTRTDKGDLALLHDRTAFSAVQRQHERSDSLRLGMRHARGQHTWIGSIVTDRSDADAQLGVTFGVAGAREGHSADVQRISTLDRLTLVAGARYGSQRQASRSIAGNTPAPLAFTDIDDASAYVYSTFLVGQQLALTAGASVQRVASHSDRFRQFNPKLGAVWRFSDSGTLRAAVFRTLSPTLLSKHYIVPSLEPTHVAGFNQQFFGPEGEDAWRAGLGLDFEFTPSLLAGIEFSERRVDVPVATVPPPQSIATTPPVGMPTNMPLAIPMAIPMAMPMTVLDTGAHVPVYAMPRRDETNARGYLFWTPHDRLALSAAWHHDRLDSGRFVLFEGFTRLRTDRLPIELNYFSPAGWTAGVTWSWVDQSGEFRPHAIGENIPTTHGADTFSTIDLSFGYRLPARRGAVSVNLLNALDQDFRFQDIDPENPRLINERMLMLRLTLSY